MKILCIGSSLLEKTCPYNTVIKENDVLRLEEKYECGGGHAGNIAYLLGKWGVETYIASMMGADDAASKIKKEYETIGVKTDFLETSYDKATSESLVLINTVSKNKIVFEIPSNSFLKKYSFSIEPDVIVADGNDFNATVSTLDKYAKARSYLVVSKYDNEIAELCRYVNTIIFNREIAEKITNKTVDFQNSSSLVDIYNTLKQKFSRSEIIITLGERGSIYSSNNQIKIMPSIVTNIVDTNGAGDVFAGAYIYGMERNFGMEKAIAYATIAASFSTTKITSRMSIPSISEVSNYYDGKFGKENNPNNNINPENKEINATNQNQPIEVTNNQNNTNTTDTTTNNINSNVNNG